MSGLRAFHILEPLIQILIAFLEVLLNLTLKCIIMADFNIDLLTTDTNHQTADFIHNMFTQSVSPPGSQTIQRRLLII